MKQFTIITEGKMYSDAFQSGKALIDFEKAIRLKKNFADAYNYRGVERAKMGLHKEALSDYDSAIISNPNYQLSYYNKGTSQASTGDYEGAIVSFSKAIELDSKHVLSYLNRGNCYVQLQDYKSGIADFSSAISHEPKNKDAYFNRGLHIICRATDSCAPTGEFLQQWAMTRLRATLKNTASKIIKS
ncbi:MAG: tetratricopeptide repeat protein [Bacteroidales bacterium]|nr:tetratricopeptide repeat protein [Bacteroidales bacterium]